jgi:modulator of FtsH protease
MDPYSPEAWHDFFIASAGAAAALTGLLFVALSLHIRYIAVNPLHRNQARGSLIGLVQVLVISLAVLVRQPASWAGIELALIGALYIVVIGGYQFASLFRANWKVPRVTLIRSSYGYLLALGGFISGLNIYARNGPGLYVTAFICVAIVVWNLRNAWALLMGVADEYLVEPTS